MQMTPPSLIVDRRSGPLLRWASGAARCAIGRGGVGVKQREGDGITPLGIYPLRTIFYRPDRGPPPSSGLHVLPLSPDDGWCDAPGDPLYNRPVKHPYPASAEKMWRDDLIYDVVAVIGFNDDPVKDGAGSAIFLHVAREDYAPTEGCVALALPDLRKALADLKPGATIEIR